MMDLTKSDTIKGQISSLLDKLTCRPMQFSEVDNSPNVQFGDCQDGILLVLNNECIELKACLLTKNGPRKLIREDVPYASIEAELEKVKLLLINPRDVFIKKPGFTSLLLENFDVSAEDEGYIVANCDAQNSYWLLPMLINECEKLKIVIAPYTQLLTSGIKPGRNIEYLSISRQSHPEVYSLSHIFPKLILVEYSNRYSSCLSQFMPCSNPESSITLEFSSWLSSSLRTDGNFFISPSSNKQSQLDHLTKYIVLFNFNEDLGIKVKETQYVSIDHLFLYLQDLKLSTKELANYSKFLENFIQLNPTNGLETISLLINMAQLRHGIVNIEKYLLSARNNLTANLKGLRIYVPRSEFDEKTGLPVRQEIDRMKRIDLSKLTGLKDILIHCENIDSVSALIITRNVECLSINFIPRKLVDTRGIKEFTFYYDQINEKKETDTVIEQIQTMNNLEKLTLAGETAHLTDDSWKRLWLFICKLQTLKALCVTESIVDEEAMGQLAPIRNYKGKKVRLKSSICKNLEHVEWKSTIIPLQMMFNSDFDLLHLYSDGYAFVKSKKRFCVNIIHFDKCNMKFTDDCKIKYLSIDSYDMFYKCFIKKILPFGENKKEKSGFFSHLESLQIEVITITNSNCIQEQKRIDSIEQFLQFKKLKILRGEISQNDLHYLIKCNDFIKIETLKLYITGDESSIYNDLLLDLIKQYQVKRIKIIFTPWYKIYDDKTFKCISTQDLNEISIRENKK